MDLTTLQHCSISAPSLCSMYNKTCTAIFHGRDTTKARNSVSSQFGTFRRYPAGIAGTGTGTGEAEPEHERGRQTTI